jgi:hypothetical protein
MGALLWHQDEDQGEAGDDGVEDDQAAIAQAGDLED